MSTTITSRFGSFELLRIFIPGTYLMFIIFLYCYTFEIPLPFFGFPELFFLIYLIGSFLAGLTLYAKETPKKRKAFQANQPSIFILERSRILTPSTPLSDADARRLYFYILNHEMPIVVHDKIFFFGMIYTVMANIRRTSFWFGILGIAALIVQYVLRPLCSIEALISVISVWVVYTINVTYNKADRKMQENFFDQIFWLEMNIDKVDALIQQRTAAKKA